MFKLRNLVITITLIFILLGCSGESWLSEDIKKINPYQMGQTLTFVSSEDVVNTVLIRRIEDGKFPDGLGVFRNERLNVNSYVKTRSRGGSERFMLQLFAITDEYEERIDFSLLLRDASLRMRYINFSDYLNRPVVTLTTDFHEYNDVVHFKNYRTSVDSSSIVEFYWSKSSGYVRLIQRSGVIWNLKSID